MALDRLRLANRARSELDRQPVDESRQVSCPAGLLDKALLSCPEAFGPFGDEGESVETETRIAFVADHVETIREQPRETLAKNQRKPRE